MKLRLFKKAVSVLFVGVLTVTGGIVLAPAANAAALCYGSTCYNKNPQTMGCGSDARTIGYAYQEWTGGNVEARYSPTCNAMWIRSASSRTQYSGGVDVGMLAYGRVAGQNGYRIVEWSLNDVLYAPGYTMMIPWGSSGLGEIYCHNYFSGYLNNLPV